MSEEEGGIPKGNTVAVVGDPGTGKTTLLLTFFAYGKSRGDSIILEKPISPERPDDRSITPQVGDLEDALSTFNKLFKPQTPFADNGSSGNGKSNNANTAPKRQTFSPDDESSGSVEDDDTSNEYNPSHLRCFISLENSARRLKDHHGKLLNQTHKQKEKDEREEEKGKRKNDHIVLIDATSMLSGRLEDMLRYPRLSHGLESGNNEQNGIMLHLADCGRKDQKGGRCWYWSDKDGREKPLDELLNNDSPLRSGLCNERPYVITLLTSPVVDPAERVRLLKDLLAILFVISRDNDRQRILALDSLSALLHDFDAGTPSSNHSPRRLHILNLVRWLEEQETTTFMACEAQHSENHTLRGHPLFLGTEERYLASGVIQLNYHRYKSGDLIRYLRVLKMRGATHDMRGYAYDLSEEGLAWLETLFGEAQQGGLYD